MLQKLVIVLTDNEHSLHLNKPSGCSPQENREELAEWSSQSIYIGKEYTYTNYFGEQCCDLEHLFY